MLVKDIMTPNPTCAEVPGSRKEILDLFHKEKISGVPVVKKGTKELVGIVTRSDLAEYPEEDQTALIMKRNPISIPPHATVEEATKILLEKDIGRLPVIEENQLTGIVTVNDIVYRAIAEMDIKEPAEKFIDNKVASIWQDTPLQVALKIMQLSKTRALLVLDDEGKLCGIVTESDLIDISEVVSETEVSSLSSGTEGDRWAWESKMMLYITKKTLKLPDKKVKDIMVTDLVTGTRRTSVSECAKKMRRKGIEQIPVIDAEGNVIGIARNIDLLKVLVK